MMERYHDEIRIGAAREAAVRTAMGELLVPASIAIFTDAAGLLVLAVSSIPLIAKLGYFCAFWSMSNLVTVTILVPMVLSFLPAPRVSRQEEHKHVYSRLMASWSVFLTSAKAPVPVFGIAAFMLVMAIYYGKDMVVGEEKPGSPILHGDSEYNIAAAHIAGKFAGANQFSIYFGADGHKMKDPEVVAVMEEFGRYMANVINFGGTRDIPNLVRSINRLTTTTIRAGHDSRHPARRRQHLVHVRGRRRHPGVILSTWISKGAPPIRGLLQGRHRTDGDSRDRCRQGLSRQHPMEGVATFAGGIIGHRGGQRGRGFGLSRPSSS